jgi:hypothetical protein
VNKLVVFALKFNSVGLDKDTVALYLGVSLKNGRFVPRSPASGHLVGLEFEDIGVERRNGSKQKAANGRYSTSFYRCHCCKHR